MLTRKHLSGVWALLALAAALLASCSQTEYWSNAEAAPAADPMLQWRDQVAGYLDSCADSDRKCLAEALALYQPPLGAADAQARFHKDLYAGYLLLEIPRAQQTLNRTLGIDPTMFSGCGNPIPYEGDYARSRGREYLAPNLDETEDNVWTWELEPDQASYSRPLGEILSSEPPTEASSTVPFTPETLSRVAHTLDEPLNFLPPATRLGQFPRAYYSGKVGRPDAVKTFFLDIRDGWHLTLGQAAEAAGFAITAPEPPTGVTLFLWLFIPESEATLVRATWGNIFAHLDEWLAE